MNTNTSLRKNTKCLFLALLASFLFTISAFDVVNAAEPVSTSIDGLAIGGHDTVAYHSFPRKPHAQAMPGVQTWDVEYLGATWSFASKKNADLFQANPSKYKPAYNGHCANALSLGKGLVKTDGTVWEIFGDQLFLFYAEQGRSRWLSAENISAFKAVADAEWLALSQ